MNTESAILRAYALASQCRYTEAEQMLKSNPEALNTPQGTDLFARILYASGQKSAAKQAWEQLLLNEPGFEPAQRALSADEAPLTIDENDEEGTRDPGRKRLCVFAATVAVALGVAFSLGKICGGGAQVAKQTPPAVIAETTLPVKLNGAMLNSLKGGILTNLTGETVLVIRGGRGKYVNDRQNSLANIADCIRMITGVPVSKMFFQPAAESSDVITLQIVPAFAMKGDVTE